MILRNLQSLFKSQTSNLKPQIKITISVPGGEEIARRTFNPRLGIEGGISIIGVSGIVKPFSEEAFIDSIRKCMTVAQASGTDRVVINSGAKSERFLRARYPDLPAQAFVQYGNYIGETLKMAADLAIPNVTLGVMLGKAVKLAEGHLDTHSRRATMNLDFVRQLLREADCDIDISDITLARELWDRLPAADSRDRFVQVVIAHCAEHCRPLLSDGELEILLIDDDGNIFSELRDNVITR
jgi:cobalt-precorrin-5B (C1)-methyltransferase